MNSFMFSFFCLSELKFELRELLQSSFHPKVSLIKILMFEPFFYNEVKKQQEKNLFQCFSYLKFCSYGNDTHTHTHTHTHIYICKTKNRKPVNIFVGPTIAVELFARRKLARFCTILLARGLFLESPENFSGPKSQLSNCKADFEKLIF